MANLSPSTAAAWSAVPTTSTALPAASPPIGVNLPVASRILTRSKIAIAAPAVAVAGQSGDAHRLLVRRGRQLHLPSAGSLDHREFSAKRRFGLEGVDNFTTAWMHCFVLLCEKNVRRFYEVF